MITNDKQYKSAKKQAELFRESLDNFSSTSHEFNNVHPIIVEASLRAIGSQLTELLEEIQEYEYLKSGDIVITKVQSIEDLPLALIKARIANRLTQAELAELLGMKMQQIQRYEAERYVSASLKTLLKVASKLNVSLDADVQIKTIDAPEALSLKNYPFKQMFTRNWFEFFSGSYNDAVKDSPNLLAKLFESAGVQDFQYSLTKKSVRSSTSVNKFALKAWYARVLIKSKHQKVSKSFHKSIIDDEWLRTLARMSRKEEAISLVPQYLRDSGIRFIIEPQIDGTCLDGAALLMEDLSPIIALTLRYDRIDNFWFVLFHEIAHIYLHLNDELDAIFDDLDAVVEGIEKEADEFALNALIPNDIWKKSLVRFSPSTETIINQAEKLSIHPALVAGRIRRETGKFHLFSDLVGQGKVRKCFDKEFVN